MSCYLISLETSGNQAYVYSTNKLRDVVGASELIYKAGTSFVEEAIKNAGLTKADEVEKATGKAVEIVIATSGKAVLLADSTDTAKKFISAWSALVTECASGVDALAVYSETKIDMAAPLGDTNGFITAFKDAGKNFSVLKSERAFVASRFQRVPVVAQCAFSGLPAEREEASVKGQPVSRVTRAKLEARGGNDLKKRMGDLFGGTYNPVINDEKGLDRLEDLDWIAVIHADGNGLGQVFTNLDKLIVNLVQENGRPAANGRDYVNGYRAFSNALDRISKSAFKKTVDEIFKEYKYASQKDKSVPVVPIVVGGDDLTVVMDGKKAIEFTKSYMVNFCEMTEKEDDISKILKRRAGGASRLGMCGEVCVTKPHFPFSASYRLAEELMKEAKKVKKIGSDCIAIDFHILYDSVATSIDDIREKFINEEEKEKVSRTAKPYVIDLRNHNDDAWKTVHSYGRFENAAKALATKKHDDATVRSLPSSQAHAIRDSLYSESITTQEAEWGYLVSKRDYKDFAEKWEEAMGSETLYLSANLGENAQKKFTYFLDALEAAEFLEGHGTLTIGGDNCE